MEKTFSPLKHNVSAFSLMASFCWCSISAFGQLPPANISGFWQPTGFVATVQIAQTGDQLSGQFVFGGTSTPVPLSSDQSVRSSGRPCTCRCNRTGRELPFSGGVGPDSFMSGEYQNGSSIVSHNWIGRRLGAFGPPTISGITNAASGLAGSLAPGEIISIYANAAITPIGPSTGVSLQTEQTGRISTALGGVQVHFLPIDVFAPLTYASAGQINAVVPYEMAGLVNANVEVQYGQTSNAFVVQVAATSPKAFSRRMARVLDREQF